MSAPTMLLWSHALLLWMRASYAVTAREDERDPVRRRRIWQKWQWPLCATLVAATVLAVLSRSASLVVLFLACAAALATLRICWPDRRHAQRELIATVVFALASWVLIERSALQLRHVAFALPVASGRIAIVCVISALLVFTIHGGTYLVRGVLNASGVPTTDRDHPEAGGISQQELKRGRWIGALERGVLFVVIIAGSYEALGFIVAAKGLIRSREFDSSKNRDFTEYFLIGSLASVAVALATGTIARYLIQDDAATI